ncbi:MAG: hypothetical protein LAN71_10775 [Acidobacteriia bacterium]|nr:hypothetical protein [Terriglobia bacterium]
MKARKILVVGGLALLIWGMGYGFWYAVFAEHQALEGMGVSLATGFAAAAQRDAAGMRAAMERYKETKYVYDRQVDIHGHWIGLAMVLMILGMAMERVGYSERVKTILAAGMLAGAVVFPLGVYLQTVDHGAGPRVVAGVAAGLVIAAMGGMAAGMLKERAE